MASERTPTSGTVEGRSTGIMLHPCCGSSLKQGTQFLAILSMALSILLTVTSGLYLLMIAYENLRSDSSTKLEDDFLEDTKDNQYCISNLIPLPLMILMILLLSILNLFLAIMLFIGAEQEDLRVCSFWWRVSLGLCVIDVVCLILSASLCTSITDIVISSAEILRSVYELWVVKAFMKEIETPGRKESHPVVNMA